MTESPPTHERCILCHSNLLKTLQYIPTQDITESWKRKYEMDIRDEFGTHHDVKLIHCTNCGVQFFLPLTPGSSNLYKQLQNKLQDDYYQKARWEYSQVVNDIEPHEQVLEIGSGTGYFISNLIANGVTNVEGAEINPKAVEAAQARGLPINLNDIYVLANSRSEKYDVVCHFHVLEHIPEPRGFLEANLKLLRPGGRIILTVPNREGFSRFDRWPLLDLPPHHITRWNAKAFESLAKILPIEKVTIVPEPLARMHLKSAVDLRLKTLPRIRYLSSIFNSVAGHVLYHLLLWTGLYRRLFGHSLLVTLRKKSR